MPGIADLTVTQLRFRVANFAQRYVEDWNAWITTPDRDRPAMLGAILRRWQACRPNAMRRCEAEAAHDAPFLESLVEDAKTQIAALQGFDVRLRSSFTVDACQAIRDLWRGMEQLSHSGRVRDGLASVVGISKATMLLTDGRVGPAFDSRVRRNLALGAITTPDQWIHALRVANSDIQAFERRQNVTIQEAVPPFAHLKSGRIYDMALGPVAAAKRER